eukprot:63313-Rhodomonas_salina.1
MSANVDPTNPEYIVQLDLAQEDASATATQETPGTMDQRQSDEAEYIHAGITQSEGEMQSHELPESDSQQDQFDAMQRAAETMLVSTAQQEVGGVTAVEGEQPHGGVRGASSVKLGESVYFNEPLEAKLASIAPNICNRLSCHYTCANRTQQPDAVDTMQLLHICNRLSCHYTYANRTQQPDAVDTMQLLRATAEGCIPGDFTFNRNRINQLDVLVQTPLGFS